MNEDTSDITTVEDIESEKEAQELLQSHQEKNAPCHLKNYPPLVEFSDTREFDDLVAKMGEVPVRNLPDVSEGTAVDVKNSRQRVHRNAENLIEEWRSTEKHDEVTHDQYLAEIEVEKVFPDEKLPIIPDVGSVNSNYLFLGKNTFSNAHYHPAPQEAILSMVFGTKKLFLWPPDSIPDLEPYPWYELANFSSLTPDKDKMQNWALPFDLSQKDPRLQDRALSIEVTGGDLLFIPQGWFHIVYGVGETLSTTTFYDGKWADGPWRDSVPRHIAARELMVRYPGRLFRGVYRMFQGVADQLPFTNATGT